MRLRKRPTVLFSVLALACCWCGLLGQLQERPQDVYEIASCTRSRLSTQVNILHCRQFAAEILRA
jgi:hypothetical protein